MKIEGTHEIRASRERLFQVLTDPEVLKRCIPGCERLEETGDHAYAVALRAGVGSIKGLFTGNVKLEDMRPPGHFLMSVDGKGQPGFLKGKGEIDLEEKEGATAASAVSVVSVVSVVSYKGDVQVGGTIAGVGQRMIQGAARMMAAQFFTAIEAEAQSRQDDPPPKHGFFRTALRWFSGWLGRLLDRKS
ncbi:MAG TPA: carbon monoxide dehydrogenase subunit G [Blastocatellia bacterium]|jgi:carbon monoxide dehydrogenase subunit G|nr:carbon monoxide dehydrogenase subunit G [Blastocatellia bacterium]